MFCSAAKLMVISRQSVLAGTPEQRRSEEPLLCKNEKMIGYHARTGWLYQKLRVRKGELGYEVEDVYMEYSCC